LKLEEIEKLWVEDSKINQDQLHTEALNIPRLHSKYYNYYVREKLTYHKIKEEGHNIEEILTGFFAKTLTDTELNDYELEYSDKRYLKQDIPKQVAGHKYMIDYKLKLAMSYEKTEFLKSILGMISSRSFQIRDALESKKFDAGN
jgi:hypothetical protein